MLWTAWEGHSGSVVGQSRAFNSSPTTRHIREQRGFDPYSETMRDVGCMRMLALRQRWPKCIRCLRTWAGKRGGDLQWSIRSTRFNDAVLLVKYGCS